MLTTTAYVAGITRRAGLGLSVLILAMRNPLVAAKQIASIMHLAGDRQFIVGVGVGWNREEYGFMNADFSRRGKLTDEYIEIMQALWTQDDPQHSGTHTFGDVLFAPRPATPPHIWIGGESKAAMSRAARIGAGYHPNIPQRVEDYAAMVKRVRELSDGRPITMSARLTIDLREDMAQSLEYLQALQDAGLEYPVVNLKHETLGELLRQIEIFGGKVIPAWR